VLASPRRAGFFARWKAIPINAQQVLQILPSAGKQAGVFVSALNLAMDRYQINTRLRMAAFIAQVGQESGQFRYGSVPEQVRHRSAGQTAGQHARA